MQDGKKNHFIDHYRTNDYRTIYWIIFINLTVDVVVFVLKTFTLSSFPLDCKGIVH